MKAKTFICDLPFGARFAFQRHPDLIFKFRGLHEENALAQFSFWDDADCNTKFYCCLTEIVCWYE